MNHTGSNVFSNLIWRFAERCGAQAISFIVTIVLARMLAPEECGVIALIAVFITVLQVFVDSGLGNALIQKKDADDLDFSTVFYTNIAFCGVLYIFLFFCAPFVAMFYDDTSLTPLIRVLGITIIISGVKNVQQAYVSRNMMFKKFFFATLGGTIAAAVVGISMAVLGCGVWALAVQQITNIAIDTIILWLTVKWRPKRMFSGERLRGLFFYGWKLLVSTLIDVIYNNLTELIIGKIYSSADLAYYNKGKTFPYFIVVNVNNAIDSVLFPVMSSVQDNIENIRLITKKSIKISVYVMAPLMMGLAFTAESVVTLLLTDKWIACVPFLRIFCVAFMLWPIHSANINAIKAMGKSDLFLKLEIIRKSIGFILVIFTMRFGPIAIAVGILVSNILNQIIDAWPNRKLLKYSYIEQLRDIFPSVLLSVGMGMIVWCVSFLNLSVFITLAIQIILGASIYFLGSIIFKIDSFIYLKNIMVSFVKQ